MVLFSLTGTLRFGNSFTRALWRNYVRAICLMINPSTEASSASVFGGFEAKTSREEFFVSLISAHRSPLPAAPGMIHDSLKSPPFNFRMSSH